MERTVAIFYCQESDVTEKGYGRFIAKATDLLVDDHCIVEGFAMEKMGFRMRPGKIEVLYQGQPFDVGRFAMVYFKNRAAQIEIVRVLSVLLKTMYPHIARVDASEQQVVSSKFTETAYLALAEIPVPLTIFLPRGQAEFVNAATEGQFSLPCIVKDTRGNKGRDNHLVSTWADARHLVETDSGQEFVLQQYIPAEGDYRFVVLGGEIAVVIHRLGSNDSHLNNTSQGATGTLITDWQTRFSAACLADVQKAVTLLQRDTAGVDVIIDRATGQHYILEVNSSPQLLSGAAVPEKAAALQKYLRERLKLTS
ncbi:MAG TPA: ATP-grasp domain-containing protein [Candidatus Saccharimonadales bacterium]|nr:ATP-grasp domain-containing protein [Candidatus Saccharimonadales bacterium]